LEKKRCFFFQNEWMLLIYCWEKYIESVNWKRKKSNYELLICDLSMKSQILYEKYPPPAKWLTLQTSNFYKRLPYSVKISILYKQTSLKTEYNLTPLISIFFVKCGLKYPAKKGAKNKKERSLLCTLTKKRWKATPIQVVCHAHKIKEPYMRGITMDKSMNIFAFSMNLVYVVLEHLVYKCDLWYACNCKIHNFLMNQTKTEKICQKIVHSLVSQKLKQKS